MKEQFVGGIQDYQAAWEQFVANYDLEGLVERPTALGWKAADLDEFNSIMAELLESGVQQVHTAEVSGRYIASFVFKEPLEWGISILKLLQRRPGSTDPIGVDHVDFLISRAAGIDKAMERLEEANVPDWQEESNDHHAWLSVRDGQGHEFKLVDHWVLDVAIQEMQEAKERIS